MASQLITVNDNYSEAYRAFDSARLGTEIPWLQRLRESAIDRFEHLGFPKIGAEEWKYTNVAPISRIMFQPVPHSPVLHSAGSAFDPTDAVGKFAYQESIHSQLIFVDGIYEPSFSSVENLHGIAVLDLAEAVQSDQYSHIVRQQLARTVDYNSQAFAALNTAFLSGGAFIAIPEGVEASVPIHLMFISTAKQGKPAVSFPRVLVVAERNSAATIIESYASTHEGIYWTNAVEEFVVGEGARLDVYRIQRESGEAFHVANTGAVVGRDGSFASISITLGSRLSRHDINVSLAGEGAACMVDGLYIVGQDQHADTHSLIDHRQPRGTSRQLYKGILSGRSRAVFNGKVFVHKGAQQTDAMQTNRNLLLSADARVDTKPQLEIFADDVKCAHGATVGQLEDEELFYFASRGMPPELARNLLTYGFAEEVISKIKVDSIKAQMDETVLKRLHARLEI